MDKDVLKKVGREKHELLKSIKKELSKKNSRDKRDFIKKVEDILDGYEPEDHPPKSAPKPNPKTPPKEPKKEKPAPPREIDIDKYIDDKHKMQEVIG